MRALKSAKTRRSPPRLPKSVALFDLNIRNGIRNAVKNNIPLMDAATTSFGIGPAYWTLVADVSFRNRMIILRLTRLELDGHAGNITWVYHLDSRLLHPRDWRTIPLADGMSPNAPSCEARFRI